MVSSIKYLSSGLELKSNATECTLKINEELGTDFLGAFPNRMVDQNYTRTGASINSQLNLDRIRDSVCNL